MCSQDAYGHVDHEDDDPTARRRAAQLAQLGEELVAGQTWRQKEIAGNIYQELKAGAHVEDIEPLIKKLHRTTIEDARDRSTDRCQGGPR